MITPASPSLRRKFMREVKAEPHLHFAPHQKPTICAADLDGLPEPAQRYFEFMGVVGRPRDVSLRAHYTGKFRLKPGPFMVCEAWQYNSRIDVARMFLLRARYGGFLPLLARDTYLGGHGRMLGRFADLVTIVDGRGPELDTGELVTYLNDAIMLAPGLVLGPESRFAAVDESSFEVTFTDRGRSVSARVSVAPDGAPIDFSTVDRFYQPDFKTPMQQTRWSTPIETVLRVDGRRVVGRARAVWHLPTGPFCYAEFALDPSGLAFNVAPGL